MHSERPLIAQLIDGYSKSQRLAGGFDAGQQLAPISALETRQARYVPKSILTTAASRAMPSSGAVFVPPSVRP
jgi:hypothetical protein